MVFCTVVLRCCCNARVHVQDSILAQLVYRRARMINISGKYPPACTQNHGTDQVGTNHVTGFAAMTGAEGGTTCSAAASLAAPAFACATGSVCTAVAALLRGASASGFAPSGFANTRCAASSFAASGARAGMCLVAADARSSARRSTTSRLMRPLLQTKRCTVETPALQAGMVLVRISC